MRNINNIPSRTERDLAEKFLLVSRCWNNYALSKANDMQFGKATKILQEVIAATGSQILRKRCNDLLEHIIYDQEEPDYLKDQA